MPHGGAAPPPPMAPPVRPELPASLTERLPSLPVELLVVATILALTGAGITLAGLISLPGTLSAVFSGGALGLAFGTLLLYVELGLLVLGVGMAIVALKLTRADKVARAMAFIILGFVLLVILFGGSAGVSISGWYLVTLLVSVASIVVLGFAPSVRQFFASHAGPDYGQPSGVVAARIMLVFFSGGLLLSGVTMFAGISLGVQYLLEALLFTGAGVACLYLNRGLRAARAGARQAATGLAAIGGVFYLWSALSGAVIEIAPLALVGIFVGLLHVPEESREFFAGSTRTD